MPDTYLGRTRTLGRLLSQKAEGTQGKSLLERQQPAGQASMLTKFAGKRTRHGNPLCQPLANHAHNQISNLSTASIGCVKKFGRFGGSCGSKASVGSSRGLPQFNVWLPS
jgi:hypothetical protein